MYNWQHKNWPEFKFDSSSIDNKLMKFMLKAGELKEVFIDGLALQRQFFFIERKGETSDLNKGFIKMAKSIYNL